MGLVLIVKSDPVLNQIQEDKIFSEELVNVYKIYCISLYKCNFCSLFSAHSSHFYFKKTPLGQLLWEVAGLTHLVSFNHLLDCLSLFNVIFVTLRPRRTHSCIGLVYTSCRGALILLPPPQGGSSSVSPSGLNPLSPHIVGLTPSAPCDCRRIWI